MFFYQLKKNFSLLGKTNKKFSIIILCLTLGTFFFELFSIGMIIPVLEFAFNPSSELFKNNELIINFINIYYN